MLIHTQMYNILSAIRTCIMKAKADNRFNTSELLLNNDVKWFGHVRSVSIYSMGNRIGLVVEIDTFDPNVEYEFNWVRVYGYNFIYEPPSLGTDKVLYIDRQLSRTYRKPLNKGAYIKLTYWFGDFK